MNRNNILLWKNCAQKCQKMKKTTDIFISKMLVVSYLQAVPICTQYPLVYFVNFWRQLPCLPFKNTSSLSEGGRHQFRSTKDGMHSTAHPTQPLVWYLSSMRAHTLALVTSVFSGKTHSLIFSRGNFEQKS